MRKATLLLAGLLLALGWTAGTAQERDPDGGAGDGRARESAAAGLGALAGPGGDEADPGGQEGSATEPDDPAWKRGKQLFHDTQELFYPSCAHCHSLVPEDKEAESAGPLGPGPTLYGSALREGWRNRDQYDNVAEASEPCAKSWQERKRGLSAQQQADLLAYLKTFVPEGAARLPARKVERKPPLLEDLAGGDAERGAKLTERFCAGCHEPGEEALSFELEPGRKRADLIARKVRGYDARARFKPEGSMSYYTTERLTDAQLRDLIAHLGR